MTSDINPIAIVLVTSGTRGNRVLFRHPYSNASPTHDGKDKPPRKNIGKNPYAKKIAENLKDSKKGKSSLTTFIKDGVLTGFLNQTLANILIVKKELCGRKFSVEIDDVRFVGFPISLLHLSRDVNLQNSQNSSSRQHFIISFNVVFVLRANVPDSVVSCYQELSQQLTVAIAHEEKRCQYLTREAKVMITTFEESSITVDNEMAMALRMIIHRSRLAGELKCAMDSLKETGKVLFHLNQWVEINFCLPHKIHALHMPGRPIQLESLYRRLSYIRPYHGMLLTKPEKELLNFLPLDSCPSLTRLIKLSTPVKNLKMLALETDLSLTQVYQLVCHMLYWGYALLIYPLCQANLYVISPSANTAVNSSLSQEFAREFPGLNLLEELSRFSLPSHMLDVRDMVTFPRSLDRLNRVVVWMLQHRLLNQLHKYVNLVPPCKRELSAFSSHSNMSSVYSNSPNSNVQVVEESYLSVLLEEPPLSTLDRTASTSDLASVNSEESTGGQSAQLSKSPSGEAVSESSGVAEETKAQWRLQDSLLNELKPQMKAAILHCPAARNSDDLHLFAKLCPYFNGKHHLEEMMFYENLHRSNLIALLDKFKEVLIVCTHEDLATSML